ncbi:MAG: hypothetical protein JXN60_05480 [Lentisphaerae bacterium]|nr:hypothetical protein [Lentisphaerota bacterium]
MKIGRVPPYPHDVMEREELDLTTYQYHMPFNYGNITVNRRYLTDAMEFHGVEMNPVNSVGADSKHYPPDTIVICEKEPIVRVVVIGSACVPPGFVQLECMPEASFYSSVDVPGVSAARFRIENLWGMHMRWDMWASKSNNDIADMEGKPYKDIPPGRLELVPGLRQYKLKSCYRESPLVGMSSAIFEIPESKKIKISGGCEICAWSDDEYPDDVHYSFHTIRVTVARKTEAKYRT